MNKYIIFGCISIFSLFNVQCSFLDEKPIDRLVVDNFYTSQKDAQAAVDATYQQLNSIYSRCMYMLCDLTCDGMKNGLGMPNAFLQNLEFLRHTPENTFIRDMWQNNYSGIMKANAAINNIPSVTMNPDLQKRFIAEAKFLRALYYFNLVRFFGDVPLVTQLETIDDAMGPRVAKEQIYEQILSDLTDAESALPYPSEYGTTDIGRATKGAAKILAGKVYLTKGDFLVLVSLPISDILISHARIFIRPMIDQHMDTRLQLDIPQGIINRFALYPKPRQRIPFGKFTRILVILEEANIIQLYGQLPGLLRVDMIIRLIDTIRDLRLQRGRPTPQSHQAKTHNETPNTYILHHS